MIGKIQRKRIDNSDIYPLLYEGRKELQKLYDKERKLAGMNYWTLDAVKDCMKYDKFAAKLFNEIKYGRL